MSDNTITPPAFVTKQVTEEKEKTKFPTEIVELPSKGLVYPKDNPLSLGTVEMKYMTAREEDLLTNANLLKKGIAIDKVLQALIITPINFNDLVSGDKTALMVAARVLGYGNEYPVELTCGDCEEKFTHIINLSNMEDKEIDETIYNHTNEFEFELPTSKKIITFKIITHGDEESISAELKGLKKLSAKDSELTTRLKHIIVAVDSDRSPKRIREFVDNEFLAKDSLAFRHRLNEIMPDVKLRFDYECPHCDHSVTDIPMPITTEFFWPRA